MRKPLIIVILILFVHQNSFSQNFILEGIIGKKEAVLGFKKEGKEIYAAKYYYKENLNVVNLEAHSMDSTHVIFYSLDANNEDTFSTFNLTFIENYHKLNGQFKANDNLKEEAYFNWLDITKIIHPYKQNSLVQAFKTEEPFLYTYTSSQSFDKNKKSIFNGKYDKLTVVNNAANDIPSIRFATANAAEKKIEAFCDSVGIEQIVASIDCGMEYEVNISVKRFDRNLVSLVYRVNWFCGGRGADFYDQGYTFNRKTGEQILLGDLFYLANEKSNSDSLNQVAVKKNEAFIRGLVKETLVNDGGSICDYDNYPLFGDKNFFIDKESIHFLPNFGWPLKSCRGSKLSKVKIIKVLDQIDMGIQPLFKQP